MSFNFKSLPTKSSQLANRNANHLVKFFESQDGILYLYGPSGSGKTFGVELLASEYAYDILYIEPPFSEKQLSAVSSAGIFSRKLVLIDSWIVLKKKQLELLNKQDWTDTRLVIIGEDYARNNPMRKIFKDHESGYKTIKFYKFTENDILGCLSIYAMELGAKVSYETMKKIAEAADGDMRSARIALVSLIASGTEKAVDSILPMTEHTYYSLYNKLFSEERNAVKDAVNVFGNYVSMIILRNTVLKSEYSVELLDVMKTITTNLDKGQEIIVDIAGLLSGIKPVRYKKAVKLEVPDIDVKCSSMKKLLYFRGYVKWLEGR